MLQLEPATAAARQEALHRHQRPGISHADLNGDSPATRARCNRSAQDSIGLDSHGSTAGSLPPNSSEVVRSGVVDEEVRTGQDGLELFLPSEDATGVWDLLLAENRGRGLEPCGLGELISLR